MKTFCIRRAIEIFPAFNTMGFEVSQWSAEPLFSIWAECF